MTAPDALELAEGELAQAVKSLRAAATSLATITAAGLLDEQQAALERAGSDFAAMRAETEAATAAMRAEIDDVRRNRDHVLTKLTSREAAIEQAIRSLKADREGGRERAVPIIEQALRASDASWPVPAITPRRVAGDVFDALNRGAGPAERLLARERHAALHHGLPFAECRHRLCREYAP